MRNYFLNFSSTIYTESRKPALDLPSIFFGIILSPICLPLFLIYYFLDN